MFGWGNNDQLQLGFQNLSVVNPRKLNFSSICLKNDVLSSVGCGRNYTVFATRNGHLYGCGSSNQLHSIRKPDINLGIVNVSCGDFHSLAITKDFRILSWGLNSRGQLGQQLPSNHGDSPYQHLPSFIEEPLSRLPIIQVSCGSLHSLALARNGTLYSWGCNDSGQLGLGPNFPTSFIPQPVKTLSGLPLRSISSGGRHSLVVTFSGAVFSWGCNKFGQLGIQSEKNNLWIPTKVKQLCLHSITSLACGRDHSAAWSTFTGKVFTFGRNNAYQLGHNENKDSHMPRQPPFLKEHLVSNVVCGELHTIFVTKSTTMFASGSNSRKQLGSNTKSENSWFSKCIKGNLDVGVIASGSNHVICVDSALCGIRFHDEFTISHLKDFASFSSLPRKANISPNEFQLIEEVFSSSSCINASFLLPDDEHMICSNKQCGLDYKVMSEMSKCLNVKLTQKIAKCLETHVLPKLQNEVLDCESLRLYVILAHLPIFSDMNHLDGIIISYSKALASIIVKDAGKVIGEWLASAPLTFVEKYLEIFKESAAFLLKDKSISEPVVKLTYILKIIELINCSNYGQRISFTKFYIPDIFNCLQNPNVNSIEEQYLNIYRRFTFLFNVAEKSFALHLTFVHSFLRQLHWGLYEHAFQCLLSNLCGNFTNFNVSAFMSSLNLDPKKHAFYLKIDRKNVIQSFFDGYQNASDEDLAKPLYVAFIGDVAQDWGGPRRELLASAQDKLLDLDEGIFEFKEAAQVNWFKKHKGKACLDKFECAGALCGLAVLNGINIDFDLPEVAYKKLLNKNTSLNDLSEIEPDIAQKLKYILDNDVEDLKDVYPLVFEIEMEEERVNLIESGDKCDVTNDNKQIYVEKCIDYLLYKHREKEFNYFRDGFFAICKEDIIKKFHASELQHLISGYTVVNFSEFESSTKYEGEYSSRHQTIRFFWKAVKNFDDQQTKNLLRFLTGSDRKPAQIFVEKFTIVPMKLDSDRETQSLFPEASTCFYELNLPVYSTYEKLTKKLNKAITNYDGFGLI